MATDLGTLLAHIGVDTTGLSGGLTRANKLFGTLGGTVRSVIGPFAALAGVAGGVFTLGAAIKGLVDATALAARVEVMNHVLEMTGRASHYTRSEIRETRNTIQALGIATKEAIQIEQLFIQSQLDIADAAKIARAAQDLAVISGQNSSEAAETLTQAIVAQRPILLKQFGIIVSLDQIYDQMAKTLGKSRDALTETEKRQGFVNEILRQSAVVAGSYTTAMRDVGKQVTSLPRLLDDASVAVGQHFTPVMKSIVDVLGDSAQSVREMAESTEQATERFYAGRSAFTQTADVALELADRYDDLAANTNRSAAEQRDLEMIVSRLRDIMPSAVTQWNDANEAIAINTERIRSNISQRKALFRVQEADLVKSWREEYNKLTNDLGKLEEQRNQLVEPGENLFPSLANDAEDATKLVSVTNKMNEAITGQHQRMNDLIIALSQGYDAVNNFEQAERELGPELANAIKSLQEADAAAAQYRKTLNTVPGAVAMTAEEFEEFSRINQQFEWPDFAQQFDAAVQEAERATEEQKRIQERAEEERRRLMEQLPDFQMQVYQEMLNNEGLTAQGKLHAWEEYERLRRDQIVAEMATLQQAGASTAFIHETTMLRLAQLDAERLEYFTQNAELMKQITDDVARSMQGSFQNVFFNWFMGEVEGLRGILTSLADQVLQMFARIAAEQFALQAMSLIGLQVPGLQHGGIVTQPTLSMIGEAGPEAVVPLSGRRLNEFLARLSPISERQPVNVTVNAPISTPNPGAFRESQSQIRAQLASMVEDAKRRL